jgi:hypothetical protein
MKGFKTVAFGVALALISIFSNAEMQAWVATNLPVVGGLTGTLVVVLRAITTSSIFKSE